MKYRRSEKNQMEGIFTGLLLYTNLKMTQVTQHL